MPNSIAARRHCDRRSRRNWTGSRIEDRARSRRSTRSAGRSSSAIRRCIARHARACGLGDNFHVISDVKEARWPGTDQPAGGADAERREFVFGTHGAAYGLGALASARRAIKAALAGDVEAVVAAPQNETSVARRRHRVRRLSLVRRARDRHRQERRVSDAVFRRPAHRPHDAACRRRGSRAPDHPRTRRPRHPRRRYRAETARNRVAET